MKKPKEIARFEALPHSMDFAWLKEHAVQFAQKYAGDLWTDYNAHDPGVTILELLSYALTDVGYRLHAPYEDLIEPDPEIVGYEGGRNFFKGRDILTTYPLTLSDYRALLVDIADVRNAWLTKHPALSHYQVSFITEDNAKPRQVKTAIWNKLSKYRNLGENFETIQHIQPYDIEVKAEISIDAQVDPSEAMANILYELVIFFNPEFTFRSLRTLVQEGHRVEDIFEGPKLDYGYLANEELEVNMPFLVPTGSEMPNAHLLQERIQRLGEVRWIRQLAIHDSHPNQRPLSADPTHFFHFNLWLNGNERSFRLNSLSTEGRKKSFAQHLQNIRLLSNQKVCVVKEAAVRSLLEKKLYENQRQKSTVYQMDSQAIEDSLDFPIPKGKSRKLYRYHSVQHHFPRIYRLESIPQDVNLTTQGRHPILQLRAFLLFFEQFIVNKLHLLNGIKYFFHLDSDKVFRTQTFKGQALSLGMPFYYGWDQAAKTYSAPAHLNLRLIPDSIPELEKLIAYPPLVHHLNNHNLTWEQVQKRMKEAQLYYHTHVQQTLETPKVRDQRLSRILDHFLATVGFKFDIESYRIFSFYRQNEFDTR
ncbi:MAG: hypothetical protein AAFR59_01805, partial [Bacteroidota bacterium]